MTNVNSTECPCGSKNSLLLCCGKFLNGQFFPKTAEQLMRSRYTAFTQVDLAYLQKSFAPINQKDFDLAAVQKWAEESQWKKLEILSTRAGGPDDTSGVVEFAATYESHGQTWVHHEISQFQRDKEGRWCYVDGKSSTYLKKAGQEPQVLSQPKVGRNDACPCGSQKKYKKCCSPH